ncbi:hypothetical protein UA08_05408 [Talaromyces atroroseus]|uniref:Rhodanese domain-containing protein n=1 Tax=Talaromyces atroroseus TaxID=1441469 RepID=A0A225APU2_TALAT|nr:hypothetical protein UA08_05408 [Talaromyces atroroseus]OKL59278.1 hypothetical protein UA08_05408 [Talaromyces atroroseus]
MSTISISVVARRGASSALRASSRSITSHVHHTHRTCRNFLTTTYQPCKVSGTPVNNFQSCQYQQRRKYSSEDQQFKQVEFEDINATLTSSRSNTILVDVREPAELAATGIIPGAVSVPLASQPDAYFLSPDEFETRFGYPKPGFEAVAEGASEPSKAGKDIIFYCKAGVRAAAAAQLAAQAGYDPKNIKVYHGSWLDWADKKGKVEKWQGGE